MSAVAGVRTVVAGTVLQAALEEILAVGYHGTSMREISKRCGLSVPGIYNYFTSKQDILMTIYQATMDDLEQRTRGALAEGPAGIPSRSSRC